VGMSLCHWFPSWSGFDATARPVGIGAECPQPQARVFQGRSSRDRAGTTGAEKPPTREANGGGAALACRSCRRRVCTDGRDDGCRAAHTFGKWRRCTRPERAGLPHSALRVGISYRGKSIGFLALKGLVHNVCSFDPLSRKLSISTETPTAELCASSPKTIST
jgi:hypothetical protein